MLNSKRRQCCVGNEARFTDQHRKFGDSRYVCIFDTYGVCICNGQSADIKVNGEAILNGWRDPDTVLFQTPLRWKVENWNTDNMLLDKYQSWLIVEDRPNLTDANNDV